MNQTLNFAEDLELGFLRSTLAGKSPEEDGDLQKIVASALRLRLS